MDVIDAMVDEQATAEPAGRSSDLGAWNIMAPGQRWRAAAFVGARSLQSGASNWLLLRHAGRARASLCFRPQPRRRRNFLNGRRAAIQPLPTYPSIRHAVADVGQSSPRSPFETP